VLVAAAGVLLLFVFLAVERRAAEPVLPIAVLRDEVFRIGALLSLIVGFALFGSVTFLPLFFQTVFASSPTGAGLRLIPLMGGLVTTSIVSGRVISRTGRYRLFPIAGTATMTIGLLLLSRLDLNTSAAMADLYLLVLGLGLGMVMQVLVLAVQNAVDYSVLGAATSGVTLARGIGGSIGAAVFGTIFTSRLRAELHDVVSGPLGALIARGGRLTGAQVASMPAVARRAYESAYVHALRPVFLVAAGVGALGFVLSLRLRERPLRDTASTSGGLDDALAAPKSPSSLAELDRALGVLVSRQRRRAFNERVAARASVDLSPGAVWALVRFDSYGIEGTREMARSQAIEDERVAAVQLELRERGFVAEGEGAATLTPAGVSMADQLLSARRDELSVLMADHETQRLPEVQQLLEQLCVELAGQRP
jgi:Major Facilitator Superfamily